MFAQRAFSLIETIVVIGLVAVLAIVAVILFRPQEIFEKNRDTQRLADLHIIEQAITVFKQAEPEVSLGDPTKVYLSLSDASTTCGSWTNQLPPLAIGLQYTCSPTPEAADGTGWLPIPFKASPALTIKNLSVDPRNTPPHFYTYVMGGSFEVAAFPERTSARGIGMATGRDNGTSWNLLEVGNDRKLIPLVVEDGMGRDASLRTYWTFDEATGTVIRDAGKDKRQATVSGGFSWQPGQKKYANSFNGSNSYLEVPNSSTLRLTKAFSLSLWIRPVDKNSGNTSQTIINKEGSYELMLSGGNPPELWWALMSTSPLGWTVNLTSVTIPRNQWHHLVMTYNGSQVKIYVNGVLRYTANTAGTIGDARQLPLRIGYRFDDPGAYLNGLVDEVRIYDRALNQEEVGMLYEAVK